MRSINVIDRVAWSVGLNVGLSVSHTNEPCKNGWTDRDAVWVDSGWVREPCIRLRSRSPMGRGNFEGVRGGTLWSIGTLCGHLCENGWTDRHAVWIVGSDSLKKSWMRWGSRSPMRRAIWGKGSHFEKPRNFLPWAVQKGLNRSICRLGCALGGPNDAQVQKYSPGGTNVPICEGTLAPHGEYD